VIAAVFAAALLLQAPVPAKGSPEQRALFDAAVQRQHDFEDSLFAEQGFEPLSRVAAEGRVVRRTLLSDPYMILPVPGVEIEKKPDGQLILRVIGRGVATHEAKLDASQWERLAKLEAGTFPERTYVPWEPVPPGAATPPPPPPPICHGWIVRFGAAESGRRRNGSWSVCGGAEADLEFAYAAEVARLAVATAPACSFEPKNPFWSFSTCFSPKPGPAAPAPR
jgi:hypothetical protein